VCDRGCVIKENAALALSLVLRDFVGTPAENADAQLIDLDPAHLELVEPICFVVIAAADLRSRHRPLPDSPPTLSRKILCTDQSPRSSERLPVRRARRRRCRARPQLHVVVKHLPVASSTATGTSPPVPLVGVVHLQVGGVRPLLQKTLSAAIFTDSSSMQAWAAEAVATSASS